jgi:cyclic dehypoxanthinyl futalosine synthase
MSAVLERLSPAEAARLYRETPLEELRARADAARQRVVPGRLVTYLIDRNVNYTNVCVTDCQFCAFYRPPGHAEGYVRTREELAAKLAELAAVGGTRVLMQGGHHPDLRLPWYEDLLRWMRREFPTIEIDAFSPSEIDHVAALEGLTVEQVLGRLREAGLEGLPGGGGEMLDDEIRREVSPKKQGADGWLDVMRVAQRLGLATTATMVIGFGESVEQRIGHLVRLRELQDESLAAHGNGFIAFIAWTAQLKNNSLERSWRRRRMGAGAEDYLRHAAVARLVLDNVPHHQASWPTMGEATAREALRGGADDFGSTMLEENVVSAAGTDRRSMSEAELQANIRAAGFVPAQRDTRYRILRTF